jgi:predicted nucleotidyltransferase
MICINKPERGQRMRLNCAWDAAKAKADKSKGVSDVDLKAHIEATGQGHLPQAALLQGCFDVLVQKGLLEEAYLRGSIGRGHADTHSDIDLFTVIDPNKIEEVYQAVNDYLASKGKIITKCHDRLVENYGGIGFMFIAQSAEHGNKTYQFDLYMAMKGTPPRNPTSIKPRIFHTDPDYKWTETHGTKAEPLPQVAKDFIKKHTSGNSREDRLELLMQEMLITLYVTNKHIKRGQVSRTVVDNHSVVTSAIEFMQTLTGYTSTGYSPVYLGDEVARFARANGDGEMRRSAEKLEKLFAQPMSQKKLRDTLVYAKNVFKAACPDRYENQREAIEFFEREVLQTTPFNSVAKRLNMSRDTAEQQPAKASVYKAFIDKLRKPFTKKPVQGPK